jgi:hypothetical protein
MAILAPMLRKQQVFAFKSESTTGTAETLTAAEGTTIVFDPSIVQDTEFNRRQGQNSLDNHKGVIGAQVATVTLTTELVGSGTATSAFSWEPLLLAAGTQVATGTSRVYTPLTGGTNMTSLTVGHYRDGERLGARGCTFDFTMTGESGKQVMIQWQGKGGWIAPAVTANIAPTFVVSPIPPRLVSATFTIGGSSYIVRTFEFKANNTVTVRRDLLSAAGVHSTAVTDRNATFTCEVERSTSKDWHADYSASTEAAGVLVIGSSTGNQWRLSMPAMQLSEPPNDVDLDGVLGAKLVFELNRSAVAGDDSFSLAHE